MNENDREVLVLDVILKTMEMKRGNIMPIDEVKVKEIIESVFTFDYVGNAMIRVRRDPKSEEPSKNCSNSS